SLGCTFYHLLTGCAPFPACGPVEKLYKHRYEEPAPVERRRPDVPPALAAVVRKLMAKLPPDPLNAATTAGAAIQTNRNAIPSHSAVPSSSPISTPQPPKRPVGKHPGSRQGARAFLMALTVTSARNSTIFLPHSMVFSAGASSTPLMRNLSAARRCFMRTVAGSTVIMIAVMAKSSCSPSDFCLIPCSSSHFVTPG